MSAEYGPHEGTWMLWPERNDIWRLGAKPAQQVFALVANEVSKYEPVTVGVSNSQFENARNRLSVDIRVVEMSYDDAWGRDCGPTFVVREDGLAGVDWHFDAWGGIGKTLGNEWDLTGSYFPWKLDDLVARKILEIERATRFRCPMITEGGAIHISENGTLLAIKECILGRNPSYSLNDIETTLREYLDVRQFIWLKKGLYLEENNGHIDNMCCFVDRETVMLNWCDDESDPQYPISVEAYDILSDARTADNERLNVIKIPQPPALFSTEAESETVDFSDYSLKRLANDRLPASYINSYVCNGAVFIPSFLSQFDDRDAIAEHDAKALEIYKAAFTERTVIQIPARELLLGGGGIHCILQQIPKVND
jgi:agmatine deiminase